MHKLSVGNWQSLTCFLKYLCKNRDLLVQNCEEEKRNWQNPFLAILDEKLKVLFSPKPRRGTLIDCPLEKVFLIAVPLRP